MAKKAETMTVATQIIASLQQAGVDDLGQLRGIIEAKEAALAADVAERRKEIDAFISLAKILDIRLNGKKARVMKAKKPKAANRDESIGGMLPVPETAQRILDCIMTHGPGTAADIARKVGKTESQIKMSLSHSKHLFETLDDGKITNR